MSKDDKCYKLVNPLGWIFYYRITLVVKTYHGKSVYAKRISIQPDNGGIKIETRANVTNAFSVSPMSNGLKVISISEFEKAWTVYNV